jgi:hypothetical protein
MPRMVRRTDRSDEERRQKRRRTAATCGAVLAAALTTLGCAGEAKAPAQAPAPAQAATQGPAPSPLAFRGPTGPIDPLRRVNGDFHTEYAAARAREQAALGASRPYFAIANETLSLRFHGRTEERSLSSAQFDAVKAASHVAITALSAVLAQEDAKALGALAARIWDVDPAITPALFGDAEGAARAVVRASVDLLEVALVKAPTAEDLRAFALRTRGDTTTLLQAGCDESLVKLDAAVRQLRPLVGEAWSQAVVVIATDHQSRAEEVGVQYFEHLLHERALGESRIVVIESIGPNDGPTQAVASHLYDQRLSVLLFDDPTFLQGDVLGKHAEPTIARLLAKGF